VPAEVAGWVLEYCKNGGRDWGCTYLMMWPGCLSALILGITSQWFSSLEVQNGCVSGTARQMKAKQAQYCCRRKCTFRG
jgi:hypothetical protein